MSLSINSSPYVKVDTSPMERSVVLAASKGVGHTLKSSSSDTRPVSVRNDSTWGQRGELMVDSSAFAKLFDMLELVFKTIREMFAGKNIGPDVLPNPEKSLKVKPDAVPQPQVKPDAVPPPRLQTDTAPQPRTMPDAGGLKPLLPTPVVPVLPAVPAPTIKVTNDANAQLKVEVSVNHCHCPDNKAEHDKGLMPRVAPDLSVKPQPDGKVLPHNNVTPSVPPKPDTVPKPEVTPPPVPTVIPDNKIKPEVQPDLPRPAPDLTSTAPADNRVDRDNRGFKPWMWLRT